MKKIIEKYKDIINYVMFGILTTIVSLFTYFFLTNIFLNVKSAIELQVANILSWICAVIFAYITNRIFVFKSKNKNKFKEFLKFVIGRLSTLFIDMLFMFIMVTLLEIDDVVAKLLVQIIIVILNYMFSKYIVFRKNN